MPDISSIPIKEAVEIIEARLPGGKWLTKLVLSLVMLALVVWTFLYVWHTAVVPLSHLVTALVTGTVFTIHVALGTVITWIVVILFYIGASFALRSLMRRIHSLMERTIEVAERAGIHSKESMEYAKQAMQFAQNAAEVAGKAIDAARTLTVRFDEMLNAKEKPKELE